jgi:hypothetical protein
LKYSIIRKKDFAMTQARKTLVSVEDTPYYRLVTRFVRRTFLRGVDKASGKTTNTVVNCQRQSNFDPL